MKVNKILKIVLPILSIGIITAATVPLVVSCGGSTPSNPNAPQDNYDGTTGFF